MRNPDSSRDISVESSPPHCVREPSGEPPHHADRQGLDARWQVMAPRPGPPAEPELTSGAHRVETTDKGPEMRKRGLDFPRP